jgi:hypothetical protein
MTAWETDLTTRDTNRIVRPLEWGFDWLKDFSQAGTSAANQSEEFGRMIALNEEIVQHSPEFFAYTSPGDFRLERRHPELYPTNVRPETLAQDAEMKRQAASGELSDAEFLRFTSAILSAHPENDKVNARWYPAPHSSLPAGKPKQAIVVMPQWNADAISHNALCTLFNRFGISALRLSKPYHDIRRPAELERSDYAVSANVGRTIAACRQAVVDIRSCLDWLETQGFTQFGVLGTSLGSCYAFIAAAHDPRLRICAFNHASTWFGDVLWTGQSTRHIRVAFEQAGLNQSQVRQIFKGISPIAKYDLTFPPESSLDVLANFDRFNVDYVSKVLPCGHYTIGETPYKFIDGWYLGSFVYRAFRALADQGG